MVSTIVSTALVPLRGSQVDSASDPLSRRAARPGFSPGDAGTERQDTPAATAGTSRGTALAGSLQQLLRRRTDRGEAADPEIRIPPHLERRRAWREAFGLNTWHTQQLAQDEADDEDAAAPARDATVTALRAYRSTAWRGRLDLNLAQRISVTV